MTIFIPLENILKDNLGSCTKTTEANYELQPGFGDAGPNVRFGCLIDLFDKRGRSYTYATYQPSRLVPARR